MKKISIYNPLFILPLAVFITNIGNGMYTLAISKVMYDTTKSTFAFAMVLVLENILIFLTQMIASITVDNGKAKQSAFFADLIRGLGIAISGILVIKGYSFVIFFGTIILNLMRPFYRTATFAIGPLIAKDDNLAKYNSRVSVFQQVGQLIGAGLAGLLLAKLPAGVCIVINGITYLISALCIAIVIIPGQSISIKEGNGILSSILNIKPRKFFCDWYELIKKIVLKKELMLIVLICTIDFNIVSYINMSYAPTLSRINESTVWLSLWDGLFAIGAVVGATIFGYAKKWRTNMKYVSIILIIEGMFAMCFSFNKPILIAIFMFGLGITNAFSVSSFSYNLQVCCEREFHGRISGLRQFAISLSSTIIVPVLSYLMNKKVIYSSYFVVFLCILAGVIMITFYNKISKVRQGD